ncbi:MAG: FecR domain-containing protein [Bdellovibrionales bacterium]|nr:FecR domain-containing protein [Bdellovibrionales bacterium]
MKKVIGVFTLIISLFVFSDAFAEAHGVFRVVKGSVQLKSGKDGGISRAKIGQKVFPKDTIITGKDSRAKIVMVDKNVINVSPESNVVFENYEYEPEKQKKNVLLNVIYGKVRSKVNQKYDGEQAKFQVKTKSAVAGVRGTDFLAGVNPQNNQSQIVTFEGNVSFGQPGPGGTIVNPVSVGVGQMAQAMAGAPPAPPRPVPQQMLVQMEKDSNADTAKGNNPSSDERTPANNKKEDNKGKSENKENGDKSKSDDKAKGQDKGKSNEAKSGDRGRSEAAKNENKTSNDTNKKNNGPGKPNGPSASNGKGPGGPTPGSATESPSTNNDGRAPASIGGEPFPPPPSGGTGMGDMFVDSDFAGSGGDQIMVGDDTMMTPDFGPIPDGNLYQDPTLVDCEFCTRLIEEGTARVLIQIQNN